MIKIIKWLAIVLPLDALISLIVIFCLQKPIDIIVGIICGGIVGLVAKKIVCRRKI